MTSRRSGGAHVLHRFAARSRAFLAKLRGGGGAGIGGGVSVGVALVVGLALVVGPLSLAAPASAAAGDASVRIANFSPDAGPLDVDVTPVGSATPIARYPAVADRVVTAYSGVPAGAYTVTFRTAAGTTVMSGSVQLTGGEAVTIAALGPVAVIQNVVLDDDLSAPATGRAAVRVVDVAALTTRVDVTAPGFTLLTNAAMGDDGPRTEVAPGVLALSLTSAGTTDRVDVTVQAGTVSSLFVVADAQGTLSVVTVPDAVGIAEPPVGGVATGGGFLETGGAGPLPWAAGALVLACLAIVARRLRPRRRTTSE